MIGVDWGTSSFRAFRLAENGAIRDRREAAEGILQIPQGGFAEALHRRIGAWLADGEDRVLLSGMVGSRQGWVEAPYLPCPAGAEELARALIDVPFAAARVKLVPGLSDVDDAGVPEVMRGEETQIIGALEAIGEAGTVCLPGSHSKWARVSAGRITGYRTHLTGEAFAGLRGHTILGRMMRDGPTDPAAFDRGVMRAGDPGGLLHHLFGVRTLGLTGQLGETESAAYLSGLLIGHELATALPDRGRVHLIGAPELCSLYARAIAARGGTPAIEDSDAAARGLARIGRSIRWS
ncbi:MAG: 2-dehydro-3-deoxygalactonokinase [Acidisphaera sp.]|nr:2-dehydro-3-deoxygalactonokinase [Acidisphaera sp.]